MSRVLKEELGFRGLVVSDYNAVQQCDSNFSQVSAAWGREREHMEAPPKQTELLLSVPRRSWRASTQVLML